MKSLLARTIALFLLLFMNGAFADTYSCINDLGYDSDLFAIRGKVALGSIDQQTFSMLADTSMPNSQEAQALLAWGNKRELCLRKFPLSQDSPFTSHVLEGFNATQSILLALYRGQISYGDFAGQRLEISNAVNSRTQQMKSQIQGQGQQQENYLMQQCLNRAKDIYQRNACQMEASGRGLGKLLGQ